FALGTFRHRKSRAAASAAVVAFFEHLPTNKSVRSDLHRWVSPDTFAQLEASLRYFLSEREFEQFKAEYESRTLASRQGRPRGSRGGRPANNALKLTSAHVRARGNR